LESEEAMEKHAIIYPPSLVYWILWASSTPKPPYDFCHWMVMLFCALSIKEKENMKVNARRAIKVFICTLFYDAIKL